MLIRSVWFRAVVPVLLWFLVFPLAAQQKYALVIGNAAYTAVTPLRNPVNDAGDMAAALKNLGWSVDTVLNGNLQQMVNAVTRLKSNLSRSKDTYGFFFYAGHGVQSKGENYLIPVDANIPSENYLQQWGLSVQVMLDELNDAGNDLNVVVLDACRDNPFGWKRSGSRGLVTVTQQPAGSIVVFATSAGSTAADGDGRNGLFTTHFLTNLKKPGISVIDLFNQTGEDVSRASGNQQFPEMHSKFYKTAYLGMKPQGGNTQSPMVATGSAVTPTPPTASMPRDMVRIPGGTFTMGSPGSEPDRSSDETQHQVTVSSFYMGKHEVMQKEYQEVMGSNPSSFKGDTLPVEQVSWFDAVEYCNKRSQREGLTPAYTVSGNGDSRTVSWNRQANGYRLPTEAEWEYACRAGTTTPYYTGSSLDSVSWYSNNSGGRTHPIGQKQANGWGLYDMHGNVFEWCWDWKGTYSAGSQTDPMGVSSGSSRVKRGGSWSFYGGGVRSAYRNGSTPSTRNGDLGFRLARGD